MLLPEAMQQAFNGSEKGTAPWKRRLSRLRLRQHILHDGLPGSNSLQTKSEVGVHCVAALCFKFCDCDWVNSTQHCFCFVLRKGLYL